MSNRTPEKSRNERRTASIVSFRAIRGFRPSVNALGCVPVTPEEVIRRHIALCDDAHALILEENRILRSTGVPPPEDFLDRKRTLLPRLEDSLERLRIVREEGVPLGDSARRQIESAQKKLMKIFMLDRENEQLLLKATLPIARMGAAPTIRKVPPSLARKAYENNK